MIVPYLYAKFKKYQMDIYLDYLINKYNFYWINQAMYSVIQTNYGKLLVENKNR